MEKDIVRDGALMIIDGHAHACGRYNGGESIIKHLDLHGIDKVFLCPGKPESTKNYFYPMLSDIFKSVNLVSGAVVAIAQVATVANVEFDIDERRCVYWKIEKMKK